MKKKLLSFCAFILFVLVTNAQVEDQPEAKKLLLNNQKEIGLSANDLNNVIINNAYFDQVAKIDLVYIQQSYLELPVYNQIQILAFKDGKLVSNKGSRITGIEKLTQKNKGIPAITANQAVLSALKDRNIYFINEPSVIYSNNNGHFITFDNTGIAQEKITAELMWVPINDNKKVVLAWQIYIVPNNSSDYWMVRVNATDNSIVSINNFNVSCNWGTPNQQENTVVTHHEKLTQNFPSLMYPNSPNAFNNASYKVIQYPAESPIHTGGTPTVVTNPWTAAPGNATTLKWHNDGTNDYNYTRGNNVWAAEDRDGVNNTQGLSATDTVNDGNTLNFQFNQNLTVAPTQTTPYQNQQFCTTNVFYWNNILHDVMYLYGFDEVAGNFQASNLSRGGLGNDYVIADAQDGSGTNNANFATPPDGSSGRMQMYLWTSTTPNRDGDLDNGIVSHEFTHGISNRLTGGPSQAGCLSNAEQMGEGWSDYYALMFTQNWATSTLTTGFNSPRGIGNYAVGQTTTATGIRSQKYCTNWSVNNKRYAATIPTESHDRGEIWCATLWDMTWNIINQVGVINPNLYDTSSAGGNAIALKIVTLGMKLQPCSPGFIDGRDAILQADQILYGGAHQCAIWEAFRRRGMGAFASQGSSGSVTDQVADFTIGSATLLLTQSVTQIPEGQNITYYNTITTSNCGGISNFILTDTLPSNVSYVSGGSYNTTNRVVSFTINQAAGTTQVYPFTVKVNIGAYYPTVTLFEDTVTGNNVTPLWTATTNSAANWAVTTARSFSPNRSYFSSNLDTLSDERLTLTNPISLGSNPPNLTFRHWYNTESTYDGGVLEASIDGGTTWTDMESNIISGGYIATMDASTILSGRNAWSGGSNNKFIKTKVTLLPYANKNLKIRFRFSSDVGTNLEGWYIDDIFIKDQAMVEMVSNLYNASSVKVLTSDTFTIITPANSCIATAITSQPNNTTVCEGNNATFTSLGSGTNPVYQWQVSTDGGNSFSNINGATNSTYTLFNVTVNQNNNQYRVIISNECPSTIISNSVLLTVSNGTTIYSQPSSASLCSGSNALFTVGASGAGLTYQWQVSTDGGNNFSNISGATDSSLSLNNVSLSQNGNIYQVLVQGTCNNLTTNSIIATLNVIENTQINVQPTNTSICSGGTASFSASATGNNITYQWQVSTDGGNSFSNISGETNNQLSISNVNATLNNNRYRVVITSSTCGAINSNAATLLVAIPVNIIEQPKDTAICENSNLLLSVNAAGNSLTFQWMVSSDGGNNFTNLPGQTSATLNVMGVSILLSGNQYLVNISQPTCGTVLSDTATVIVHSLPIVSVTAQPNNVLMAGQTITLTAISTPTASSYNWYKNNSILNGQTANTITVNSIGNYSAKAIDMNGCIGTSNIENIRDSIVSYSFIFPNPNKGKFQVRYQGVSTSGQPRLIAIYDTKGARVYQKYYSITSSYQLLDVNVPYLSKGLYMLVLYDESGKILKTGKVDIE